MNVTAKHNYLRMSPRKVQAICDLVRGMDINQAKNQLQVSNKKAARPVAKLLKSAVANAEHNYNLNPDQLYIKNVTADKGPTLKRWQSRAFGRVTPIEKKTTHLKIILAPEKGKPEIREKKKYESSKIETKKEVKKARKKQRSKDKRTKSKKKPSPATPEKGKRKEFFRRKSI